ncbi:MAG TPA: DUF1405 domain-containing protein [Oscillospiraceae bacterium]|nr:DUF1405 domain-containing protein [Oscillospiraceae bacterium]
MRQYLKAVFNNKLFFVSLLVINFIGIVWGFWWYQPQFVTTPPYLWPFVPNSPLAVLYFFLVLLRLRRGRRHYFLEGFAYFGLIKHGLWTVVIITVYQLSGYRHFANILLWSGHLGMALEASLFWFYYRLPLNYAQATAIAAWYFFNDYLDYVVGIYPRVDTTYISVAAIRNISVSFGIVLTILLFNSAWKFTQQSRVL